MSRTKTPWLAATCAAVFVATTHGAAAQSVKSTTKPAPVASKTAPPASSLTGCRQNDGDRFNLTNLPEGQAPKGRNWKTAYVTTSTKDVEVVGASRLKLKDHVGHKVTITGTRDGDTRVKATSVKMVATRCS